MVLSDRRHFIRRAALIVPLCTFLQLVLSPQASQAKAKPSIASAVLSGSLTVACGTASGTRFNLEPRETPVPQNGTSVDFLPGQGLNGGDLVVGVANDFVKLNQIDPIGLQPAERVVQLLCGGLGVAPINLGHQKYFLAVPVAQGFAHSDFADAAVVIPGVIEKVYTTLDSHSDDSNALSFGDVWPPEMIAANPYNRDFLVRAA